ncbi:dihydrodipicolinate synthase family protein [soil metagenome]
MARFHGIWPAMPSPLTEDFEVDVDGTANVVNWLIDNGVHGISALGSTGECAGLSKQQRRDLLKASIDASAGRVPVMGGANGTNYSDVVADLEMCGELGAVGALTPPPFYYPLEDRGVIEWFTSLADESPVPIFLYHIPRMTKVVMTVKVVEELAQHENIAGLKDSDGQLAFFSEVARIGNEVDDFSAFTGSDAMLYPALCVGGHGIIGAHVNVVPDVERAIYDAFQAGDHEAAVRLQRDVVRTGPVPRVGNFPAGIKGSLAARGLCGPTMTRPIPSLTASEVSDLRLAMTEAGIMQREAVPAD